MAQDPEAGAPAAGPDRRGPSEAIELSVIVPVHDEAENIEPLVGEIRAALAGGPSFEIIYVDDASRDGTAALLKELSGRVPQLRWLRHATNVGQSGALLSGLRAARGNLIATLDGDGQNDPADLPRMLKALAAAGGPARVQAITGVRTRRQDNFAKRYGSRIANAVRRACLGDEAADSACGIRVVTREAFLRLPYFDHLHRFVPALLRREGYSMIALPVNHRPRTRGRSKYGTWDRLCVGIVDLFGVMWLMKRRKRTEVTDNTP